MLVLQKIITLLIVYEYIGFGYTQINNCGLQKFQCYNGECIVEELLCDGTAHCKDWSDETEAECTKILCPDYAFRCNYGACINGDSVCNGVQNCVDNSDETQPQCRTTDTSNQTSQLTHNSHPVVIRNTRTCTVPAQPQNGYWKLHQSQCPNEQECDVPEGTEPSLGSHLVYSCNPGYEIKGSRDVYCSHEGEWSDVPVCTVIRCTSLLSTKSTEAKCIYNDELVSCESPLSGTKGSLTCRSDYRNSEPYESLYGTREVRCNAEGQWEPQPVQCIIDCGYPFTRLPLFIERYNATNILELPWHVSMYRDEPDELKKYFCGASIIRENLLITAAHCVYDENTRRVTDKTIYIEAANAFREYSPPYDTGLIKKNEVKNIYIMCNYSGLEGNYMYNIALLELVEPFILLDYVAPICIDSSSDLSELEEGDVGNVVGFDKTIIGASSGVLQPVTIPYIPYNQCKSSGQSANAEEYITADKFCAGYSNVSSVCAGDSGSGLAFNSPNGRWYLRGIFSVSLSARRKGGVYCDKNSYSLYTRISSHIRWIEDVINTLEQDQPYPSCHENSESSLLSTTVSTPIRTCRAPPQPQNGYWKLPGSQCSSGQDCDVPEETELHMGSYLIYSCNAGYEMKGSSHVSCSFEGNWLDIPVCTEIRCRALSTVSVEARCTYNNEWVSCGSPVLPRTRASLSCHDSYQRDLNSFARRQVRCNENGQWEPEPMRCVPVCGKLPADVTPLIVNGVTPNITEFPWHASMYYDEPGESKKYFCGASIIQENLLITAAHCVYDEITRLMTDKTIYIVTGNIFRDYESPLHDSRLVKRNQVKNIYLMCDYIGLTGNYKHDIAILELVEPFILSAWLVPVCIDFSNDLSILEVGAFGKVAGFGRTAIGESSGILQALTVPYITYAECRNASQNANVIEHNIVDKFCAGYSNGSSVCDGDSGSGLVFEFEGLWYLQGIVSVALGTIQKDGTHQCENNFYSLYTRVSRHVNWIQNMIVRLKQNQTYQSCQDFNYEYK